jgi:hypothetical protein
VAHRTPQPPASRSSPSGPPWPRSRRVITLNPLSKKDRAVQDPIRGPARNTYIQQKTHPEGRALYALIHLPCTRALPDSNNPLPMREILAQEVLQG